MSRTTPILQITKFSFRRSVLRHLLEVAVLVSAYFIYEVLGKFGTPNSGPYFWRRQGSASELLPSALPVRLSE